jgi:hypothetical protein
MVGGAVITGACFLTLQIWLIHAGSRDYDEGVYWQSIRAMLRGEPLFRSVFASQPPAFYYALLPFYLLSHSLIALRVTVLFFAIIGAAATYLTARLLAGPWAGLAAAILLVTSPLYIKEAAIAQADMPAVAMTVVSIAIIILATRQAGGRSSILAAASGLAFAVALGMKLLAAVAIVPLLLYLLLPRRQPVRVLWAFVAGTAAGIAVVLIPALPSLGRAYDDLVASHLLAGRAIHAGVRDNLAQLLQLPELPLLALGVVGSVLAIRRRDPRIIAPLAWSLTGIVAVLIYQPLFPHHLLLLPPALALTGAIGFADLAAWRPAPALAATSAVMLAAAIGLAVGFRQAQRVFIPNGHGAALASALDSMTDPGDFVISDNPFAVALADRDIPGPLVDTSHERSTAGLLTVADLDAAREYYSVKVVLIDGTQLLDVPGFSDWLAAHYRLVRTIGSHASLYTALQESD